MLTRRFQFLFSLVAILWMLTAKTQSTVQVSDSVTRQLSALAKDSLVKKPAMYEGQWIYDHNQPLLQQILIHHPYLNYRDKPMVIPVERKQFYGKENYFYLLAGLFLLLAVIKLGFPKYFNDLLRVFFRTTLNRGQLREQLVQNPAPSVLFNFLFILVLALYIVFNFYYFGKRPFNNFWLFYFTCCVGLAIIYLFKFLILKFWGWLFSVNNVSDSYLFVVFLINKMIGILLLPLLCFMAFSSGNIYDTAMFFSWIMLGCLFLYRLILGFGLIRRDTGFSFFHFLLFVLAFEISPVLVIYKLALMYS